MRTLLALTIVILTIAQLGSAQELVFFDNFNDGNLDGWTAFGTGGAGHLVWVEDSELWVRASSGGDCSACSQCKGCATIDGLLVRDFTIELKMTNHNNCGQVQLRLRTEQPTWSSQDELGNMDHWMVSFDPGLDNWQLGARVDGLYLDPGLLQGFDFPYGIGVPHYFRIVLVGQTLDLWHRTEGGGDYQLAHSLTVEGGATEGYVVLVASQSAKHGSFDDVFVYAHNTPVEQGTWGSIKALYR